MESTALLVPRVTEVTEGEMADLVLIMLLRLMFYFFFLWHLYQQAVLFVFILVGNLKGVGQFNSLIYRDPLFTIFLIDFLNVPYVTFNY